LAKTEPTAPPKVVRAIDLGWGWTKYSKRNEATGAIEYHSFPSLAPRSAGVDLSLSVLGKRDTVIVKVEGTEYEVGPDSTDLDSNDATRNLNEQYIHSDQYSAVFLGALHYIAEPVIDLLVVGLPLSNMHLAPKLREMLTGTHSINDFEIVEVKDVLVLPQPMGSLYHCLSQKDNPEFEFLREEVNLVIDPGFLTLDFLLSNGEKVIENRSGAHIGGVSKVLRGIAESISNKFGIRYENLSAIDKGLRRRKLKINGEVEELDEHVRATKPLLDGSINYMRNVVGDGSDVDNIILVGGGAHIFRKAIERHYPKHKLMVLEDSQLTNVMGFQKAGEAVVAAGGG
jgi:plasmid segregation protein ParM